MEDRSVPVQVNIDEKIPIHFKETFEVPVSIDTQMDINESVEVETEIPVNIQVPIETIIETKVLGIGKVEIHPSATTLVTVSISAILRIAILYGKSCYECSRNST